MKSKFFSKKFLPLWFGLFALIFIIGCTDTAKFQDQPEVTAKMPTATGMPTTNQPVVERGTTATLSPTKKPVPTVQPVSTLIIGQKTLLEYREKLLQEFMQTNAGCQLPCWWGIELGESIESIEKEFINYGINPIYTPSNFNDIDEQGYVYLGYYNPITLGDDVGVGVSFHPIDGKVQFIDVLAERPLRQYGEEVLLRDWEKYSISSMLQQYGKPPYVYLFPQSVADPGPLNFNLLLYYPELGFTFEYGPFDVSSSETQADLCLGLENIRQISLSLYNPEFVYLRPYYLLPPERNPDAEEIFKAWTWEAITGMDLDMFYELYKSNNPECIQITS